MYTKYVTEFLRKSNILILRKKKVGEDRLVKDFGSAHFVYGMGKSYGEF